MAHSPRCPARPRPLRGGRRGHRVEPGRGRAGGPLLRVWRRPGGYRPGCAVVAWRWPCRRSVRLPCCAGRVAALCRCGHAWPVPGLPHVVHRWWRRGPGCPDCAGRRAGGPGQRLAAGPGWSPRSQWAVGRLSGRRGGGRAAARVAGERPCSVRRWQRASRPCWGRRAAPCCLC